MYNSFHKTMHLIALTVLLIVFVTAQAEDCLNYDAPLEGNLKMRDIQRECRRESEEEHVDYMRCIQFKLRLANRENREPDFERYREFTNRMIRTESDRDILLKAVDNCKENEYVGDEKFEKFITCWETKFRHVCKNDQGFSY